MYIHNTELNKKVKKKVSKTNQMEFGKKKLTDFIGPYKYDLIPFWIENWI